MNSRIEQRIDIESPILADTIEKLLANPESQLTKERNAAWANAVLLKNLREEEITFLNLNAIRQRELEDDELARLEKYLREKAEKRLEGWAAQDKATLQILLAAFGNKPLDVVIKSELDKFVFHLGQLNQASQALQTIPQQRAQLAQNRQAVQTAYVNTVVNGLNNFNIVQLADGRQANILQLADGRQVEMQPLPAEEVQELQNAAGPASIERICQMVPEVGTQYNALVNAALPPPAESDVPTPPARVLEVREKAASKMNLDTKPLVNKHLEARRLVTRWLEHNNLTAEDMPKILWPNPHPKNNHIQNLNRFAEALMNPEFLRKEIKKLITTEISCSKEYEEAQCHSYLHEKSKALAQWNMLASLISDPRMRAKLQNLHGVSNLLSNEEEKRLLSNYTSKFIIGPKP